MMANAETSIKLESDTEELCRTCISATNDSKHRPKLIPIFSKLGDAFIANIITKLTAVQIEENDGLPAAICLDCFETVKLMDAFAKTARDSDARLRLLCKADLTGEKTDPDEENILVEIIEEEVLEEVILEEVPAEAATTMTHFLEIKLDTAEQLYDETTEEPAQLSDAFEGINDTDSDWKGNDEDEEEEEEEQRPVIRKNNRVKPEKERKQRRRVLFQREEDLQLSQKEQELFTVIEIPPASHLCCGCLMYFESPQELDAHRQVKHIWKTESLRKPHSKPFCENCLRRFCTTNGKERHIERNQLLRVIWECKKCHVRFKIAGKRREHLKLHPNDEPKARVARMRETTQETFGWVCCGILCKASFTTEAELIAHGQSAHWVDQQDVANAEKPLQCQVCYQRFADRIRLTRHQRRKYRFKNQQCSHCGLKFISTIDLQSHEVKAHGSDYFKCEICDKSFTLKRTLNVHIRTMHLQDNQRPQRPPNPPIQTEEDLRLAMKEQELFTDIEIPPNSHVCCGCLLCFDSPEELDAHRLLKHVWKKESLRKPTSQLICEGCLRRFGTASGMAHHKKKIQLLKVVWECKKCQIRFKCIGKRREHAKLHPDGEPVALVVRVKEATKQALGWVCCGPMCTQSFNSEEELIAHGQNSHWIDQKAADLEHADKPEQCQICFQRFHNRKQIVSHQRRKYKLKNVNCTLCGQMFTRQADLQRHEVKVHKHESFKCDICGKSYISRNSLKFHIRVMHLQEKQHMCTVCGKTFRQTGGLQIHMSTHVEVPQYKCDICSKMFKAKQQLRNHMRTHTGEKPHKCQYCDSAFANHTNWRRHEMTHTGNKPHKCSYCEKSFILRRTLLDHESSHTGEPKPTRKAKNQPKNAKPKSIQVNQRMEIVEVDHEYYTSSDGDNSNQESVAESTVDFQQKVIVTRVEQPETVQSAAYAAYNVIPTVTPAEQYGFVNRY